MNVNQKQIKKLANPNDLPVRYQVPRHAVCHVVLNLPKQDGSARSIFQPWPEPIASVLAGAVPFCGCWLKTGVAAARAQQGNLLIPCLK